MFDNYAADARDCIETNNCFGMFLINYILIKNAAFYGVVALFSLK